MPKENEALLSRLPWLCAHAEPRRWLKVLTVLALLGILLATRDGLRDGGLLLEARSSGQGHPAVGSIRQPAGGGPAVASVGTGAATVSGDDVVSFNVIMTTNADRATLPAALDSILPQLQKDDFITLISDENHQTVAEIFAAYSCNCTKLLIQNAEKQGWWGHGSRTKWQKLLPGTWHMNADDDDFYPPNAMALIRRAVSRAPGGPLAPNMLLFRMVRRWDGKVEVIPPMTVKEAKDVVGGKVGTPCAVYRALRDKLPDWTGRYGGDGDFFVNLAERMPVTVIPEVIYHVGQREDLLKYVPKLLRGEAVEHGQKVEIALPPSWVGQVAGVDFAFPPYDL